jgi:hypothetical protein
MRGTKRAFRLQQATVDPIAQLRTISHQCLCYPHGALQGRRCRPVLAAWSANSEYQHAFHKDCISDYVSFCTTIAEIMIGTRKRMIAMLDAHAVVGVSHGDDASTRRKNKPNDDADNNTISTNLKKSCLIILYHEQ